MSLLEKKDASQTRQMDRLLKEASLTAEAQKQATGVVVARQFLEQEEVQHQFESEVTRTTSE